MKSALDDLLSKYDWRLLSLARRMFVMEAFKTELDRVSRNKPFRIRNDVTWLMLLDSRDMLVVQLASWAKGVYEPGGLIGSIQAAHGRDLPRRRPPSPTDHGETWNARRDREHAESFGRLFPSVLTDAFPTQAGFAELKDSFVARLNPVLDDRHNNRAHPYEKAGKGSVKMLDLIELRDAISYCETFMNDVRMVGCQQSFDFRDMNNIECEEVARDLVDMLLVGTSDDIRRFRGATEREAFYESLHQRHDRGPRVPTEVHPGHEMYFNDRLWG